MKHNLILRQFDKNKQPGTYNLLEQNSFFGSKVLEIEDLITIDDMSITYSELNSTDTNYSANNGYQYVDTNHGTETDFEVNLIDLKKEYFQINISQQTENEKRHNTKWEISIDTKSILKAYLFAKIKERRSFKGINYSRLLNRNINGSIYEYIDLNVMRRFKFYNLNLYIRYANIDTEQSAKNTVKLQYNPTFTQSVKNDNYLVKNLNIIKDFASESVGTIKINYNQTQTSTQYKLDYYYDLFFQKI